MLPVEHGPAHSRRTVLRAAALVPLAALLKACDSSGSTTQGSTEILSKILPKSPPEIAKENPTKEPTAIAQGFILALCGSKVDDAMNYLAPDQRLLSQLPEVLGLLSQEIKDCEISDVISRERSPGFVGEVSIVFVEPRGTTDTLAGRFERVGIKIGLDWTNKGYFVNINKMDWITGQEVGFGGRPGRTYVSRTVPTEAPSRTVVDREGRKGESYVRRYAGDKSEFSLAVSIPPGWFFWGDQADSRPSFAIFEGSMPLKQDQDMAIKAGNVWMMGEFSEGAPDNPANYVGPRWAARRWTDSDVIIVSKVDQQGRVSGEKVVIGEGEPVVTEEPLIEEMNVGGLRGQSQVFVISYPGKEPFWIQTFIFFVSGTDYPVFALHYGGSVARRRELEPVFRKIIDTMEIRISTPSAS